MWGGAGKKGDEIQFTSESICMGEFDKEERTAVELIKSIQCLVYKALTNE